MITTKTTVFVGTVGEGLYSSSDGGKHWNRTTTGLYVEGEIRSLAYNPSNYDQLFAGTHEGVFRSDDRGITWQRLESEMNDMAVWALLVLPSNPKIVLAGTRPAGLFRSTDSGNTWKKVTTGMQTECAVIIYNRVTTLIADPANADRVWMGVEIDGAWCSEDAGITWDQRSTGLSSMDVHGLAIVPDNAGYTVVASTNNDINLSTDAGQTWIHQNVEQKFPWRYCRGIKQQVNNPEILYLGNGDGPPGSKGAMFRSQDGAQNWDKLQLPVMPNSTIWDYAVHPSDHNLVYAYSCSGEVYQSGDAGNTWTKFAQEFGEIRSLMWVPSKE